MGGSYVQFPTDGRPYLADTVSPSLRWLPAMPIRPYLDGHTFDPETVRLLGIAFEITRAALKIGVENEPAREAVARMLIELAEQGERDPDRLSEEVLARVS